MPVPVQVLVPQNFRACDAHFFLEFQLSTTKAAKTKTIAALGVGHLQALGNALGEVASTTNRPGGHPRE
jgi:hypothetical protein